MLIKIKPKHFKLATSYLSCYCPLYFALKDVFKDKAISVGGFSVMIGNNSYKIQKEWGEFISKEEIDANIKSAKQKKKTKSYDVELT